MKDRRQLYNDFLKAFPMESLKNMTLEQYTDLKKTILSAIGLRLRLLNLVLFGVVVLINLVFMNIKSVLS